MQHTWSAEHSRYCCYKREIGCKTKASDASERELACCLGSGSFNQLDLLFESAAALSADLHFCALSTAPLSVDPLAFCRNYAFV